jgi:hypothetical protein
LACPPWTQSGAANPNIRTTKTPITIDLRTRITPML